MVLPCNQTCRILTPVCKKIGDRELTYIFRKSYSRFSKFLRPWSPYWKGLALATPALFLPHCLFREESTALHCSHPLTHSHCLLHPSHQMLPWKRTWIFICNFSGTYLHEVTFSSVILPHLHLKDRNRTMRETHCTYFSKFTFRASPSPDTGTERSLSPVSFCPASTLQTKKGKWDTETHHFIFQSLLLERRPLQTLAPVGESMKPRREGWSSRSLGGRRRKKGRTWRALQIQAGGHIEQAPISTDNYC